MRVKYSVLGIVLGRVHTGEAHAIVSILTPELGLVRARAQSVRKSGAKLAAAVATFAESDVHLVRGKECWHLAGAVLRENWFVRMRSPHTRAAAARVCGLLKRLVASEAPDTELFPVVEAFFNTLVLASEEELEAIEILAALRVLAILGFDQGGLPGETGLFNPETLALIATDPSTYITRVNTGIAASGL